MSGERQVYQSVHSLYEMRGTLQGGRDFAPQPSADAAVSEEKADPTRRGVFVIKKGSLMGLIH